MDYLKRQLYGGKAERYINPDPQARQLELFEGVGLLPGEKEAAAQLNQLQRVMPHHPCLLTSW